MPVLSDMYWPLLGQVGPTMLGMSAVAMEGGYDWRQIDGVQVFIQKPIFSWTGGLPASKGIHSLANSMTPSMRYSLVNEGVLFDELSEYQRDLLSPIWKGQRGLARQILMRSGETRIKISFNPSIVYQDDRGYEFNLALNTDVDGDSYAPEPNLDQAASNGLELHSPGQLDFGRGKTMTALDIVIEATREFGVRYSIDSRIANAKFFVSGSMDQVVWEKVLPIMTDTKPGKRSFSESEATGGVVGAITALLLELAQNPDERLDMHMNGGRMTAAKLQSMNPSLAARFKQLGISPTSLLDLTYGINLEIQAPGYRLVKMPDGSEQLYSNTTSFFFSRR
ncbi:MAG: hypothetical protein IH945_11810 [Armatimonadetes bacterium]|nr:hypothetical protein [Armatimonadota bacterium]